MKLTVVLILATICITVTEGCIEGWVQHNNMCYFLSHDKATWYESLAVCSSVFGNLAEPSTPDIQNFLISQLPAGQTSSNPDKYWIGVSDIFRESKWMFISTQQHVGTSYWYPGEPNNAPASGSGNNDEDCVVFNWDGKGAWNDYTCTSRYFFACQKENEDVNVVG